MHGCGSFLESRCEDRPGLRRAGQARRGHSLDLELASGRIEISTSSKLHLSLPGTQAFLAAKLSQEDIAEQIRRTEDDIERYNGHMLASTWLQCAPREGVGGPFAKPGGHSRITDVDANTDKLHPDAGVAWWLDFVKEKYGPWKPSVDAD